MPYVPRDPEAKAASAKKLGISEEKMRAMEAIPMPASQASDQASGNVGGHGPSYSTELEDIPYVPTPEVKDTGPTWLESVPKAEDIAPPNAHLAFLEDVPKNKSKTQEVFEQFRDSDPDHNAKVAEYSQKFGQPPEFIDKNIQKAEKAAAAPAPSAFEEMEKEYPGSTKYFSRPENMAVAHDGIEELKGVEAHLQERGFWGKIADSIASGVYSMGKSLAQVPAVVYDPNDTQSYPSVGFDADPFSGVNVLARTAKEGQEAKKKGIVPKSLYQNDITESLDLAARGAAPEELSDSVIKETAKGNYARASKAFAFQVASNMPQLALILVNPEAGLAALGVASTSGKMADNLEKGVDPNKARLNALAYGGIETGIEALGGIGAKPLQQMIKEMVKNSGKETAKQVIKDGFKSLAKNAAEEGAEEFVTSLAQDTVDWAMGVNPDATKGMLLRAFDASLIGAGAGLSMSAVPTTVGTAARLMDAGKEIRTTADKEAYLAFGEAAKESKLWGRSKEQFGRFVDHIAAAAGSDFVYLSPKALETYFQGKEGGAIELMTQAGELTQYNQAKETGAYVKIPLSTWTRVTLETPHFNALANDVKFHPEQQSVNEQKEDQKLAEEAFKKLQESKASPEEQQKARDRLIIEDVAGQLKAINEDPVAAELYRGVAILARNAGLDPLDVFRQYDLRITREGAPRGDETAAQYDQKKYEKPADIKLNYEPAKGFDLPSQRRVEESLGRKLSDMDAGEAAYNALPDPGIQGGKILDTDAARALSPEYASNGREGPMLYTQSTHAPAGQFIWNLYKKRLALGAKGLVVLGMGGGGSGKSTVFRNIARSVIDAAKIVYDGTGQRLSDQQQKITDALESGHTVRNLFVYTEMKDAARRAKARFKEGGRSIPPDGFVRGHIMAVENFLALFDEYKDSDLVDFVVYDNSGPQTRYITVADLAKLRYIKDGETVDEAVKRLLPEAQEILREAEQEIESVQHRARTREGVEGQPRGLYQGGPGSATDGSRQGEGQGSGSRADQAEGRGRGADQQRQAGEPLPGLPASSPGPLRAVRQAALRYLERAGLPAQEQSRYVEADPARGKRIADEYANLQHNPSDPEVIKAYDALIEETLAQYQVLKEIGLKIEAIQPGQENPYKSSRDMIADVQRGHLWFFPTDQGFGQSEAAGHPLLRETPEKIGDRVLLANDVFRIVHDFFGHAKEGVGFGPHGEENAFQAHVRMYSPLAARAMATETRGQNSWVNFGPMGEANRKNPENTVYAEQKAGLMPEWVMNEGVETVLYQTVSPIGFYSQLEKEIEKMDFKAIPAKDLLNRIKNIQGLKREELEAIEFEEWLTARASGTQTVMAKPSRDVIAMEGYGRKYDELDDERKARVDNDLQYADERETTVEVPNKVTKEEVLEFVKQNGVQVDQIVLSDDYSGRGRSSSDNSVPTADELSWDDGDVQEPDYNYLSENAYEYVAEQVKVKTGESWSSRKWIYDLEGRAFWNGLQTLKDSGELYAEKLVEEAAQQHKGLLDDGLEEGSAELENELRDHLKRYVENELQQEAYDAEVENYYHGDSEYQNLKFTESETGYELLGRHGDGEWYCPETRKHYSGSIDEAKIKLLEDMIDKGVVRLEDDGSEAEMDESDPNKPTMRAKWGPRGNDFTVPHGTNYREVLLRLPQNPGTFTYSTHWDDIENVIAHLRLTDRIIDGKKFLFLEEGQSDWAKMSRELGVKDEDKLIAAKDEWNIARKESNRYEETVTEIESQAARIIDALLDRQDRHFSTHAILNEILRWNNTSREDVLESADYKKASANAEIQQLKKQFDEIREPRQKALDRLAETRSAVSALEKAVPNAPMLKAEGWGALAMKRLIRLAAEQGYDGVALSPPEVHTKRWGTDVVAWEKRQGGGFEVVTDRGKAEWFETQDAAEAFLEESNNKHREFAALSKKVASARDKHMDLGHTSRHDAIFAAVDAGDLSQEELDRHTELQQSLLNWTMIRQVPEHWLVSASEQRGGFANGMNIEEAARQRGKLLERNGERVTSKEQLRELLENTLSRERDGDSIENITESTWKQMQAEGGGVKTPRQDGLNFIYGSLFPRKILPPILKKLDPSVKIEVKEIETSGPRRSRRYEGPTLTAEQVRSAAANSIVPETLNEFAERMDDGYTFDAAMGRYINDVGKDIAKAFGGKIIEEEKADTMKVLGFPITPAMREKAMQGFSLFQGDKGGEARGMISFGKDRKFEISLLKSANKSTFIHETGHFYLEVMGDLVEKVEKVAADQRTDQQKRLVDDYYTLLKWAGAKDRASIEAKHHEKIARGLEQYLFEGKAPSPRLREIFARFRTWLLAVYKNLGVPDAELSDDVRDVFGRMLAAEEEIDAKHAEMSQPLFSDPKFMGMSLEKTKAYLKAVDEAKEHAVSEVNKSLLRYHNKVRSQEYKRELEGLLPDIENEVSQRTVYQAIEQLQETKLNFNSVAEFGKEVWKGLPKGVVASKKGGEGIPVEMAAELYGMSPQELISELTAARPKADVVNELANQEMAKRYPDLLETGLDEEVLQAVHNQSRAKLLRMELEHLASNNLPVLKEAIRRVARRVPTDKAIRAQAQKIIGAKSLAEISPYDYQRAEARAAKEAGVLLAKGDVEGAFDSKLKELLNHELFVAATKARDTVEKFEGKFEKLAQKDEKLAKQRDMDLVNTARAILARYGIGKADGSAEEALEKIQAYDPEAYETVAVLVNDATRHQGRLEDMSFNDFLGLADSVMAIWELSRSMKLLEIDGKKVERDEAIKALAARANELAGDDPQPGVNRAMTDKDKRGLAIASLKSLVTRVEHWAYGADKGDLNGAFTRLIVRPVLNATTAYRNKRVEVMKELAEIVRGFEAESGKIAAPELQYEFTKPELLMAILHSGNTSNLDRLLGAGRGKPWGEIGEDGHADRTAWDEFMARMWREGVVTKQDMDQVQKIWDLNEKLKPAAQKAHKKMYGYYFNEITAEPIVTPWGEYKGGYMPAVADFNLSTDADIRKGENELKESPGQMFPTTGRGFTKSRAKRYATPLSLDFSKIKNHLDKVIRFTYIEPAVKDSARLLNNRDLRSVLNRYDASLVNDLLMPWLKRAATQKASTPGFSAALDRGLQVFRRSSSIQFMVLNVVNAIQNTTSIFPAMTRVGGLHMAGSVKRYLSGPGTYAAKVQEMSAYMKSRIGLSSQELVKDIDDFVLNPGKYEKFREWAIDKGYVLDRLTNGMMEVIVWGGAYEQHFAETQNHDEAVQFADATVRQTIAGMNPEDVSRAETGSPFVRLFTMFSTFFNTQGNLLKAELTVAREERDALRAARALALVVSVPAIASALIFRAMAGKGLDEDDDGEYIDDFFDILFGSQFRFLVAMVPGGGVLNSVANRLNNKPYDDKINLSPGLSSLDKALGALSSVPKAISGRGDLSKAIKDVAMALGLLTGFPVAPLAKPLGYMADVKQKKARPTNPVGTVRGLVTGQK